VKERATWERVTSRTQTAQVHVILLGVLLTPRPLSPPMGALPANQWWCPRCRRGRRARLVVQEMREIEEEGAAKRRKDTEQRQLDRAGQPQQECQQSGSRPLVKSWRAVEEMEVQEPPLLCLARPPSRFKEESSHFK